MRTQSLLRSIFILSILSSLFGCKEEQKPKKEVTYSVKTQKINSITTQDEIDLLGELKSEGKHELSFLVDGKLIKVYVKEGQNIKKGQKIAQLDRSDYQQALEIYQAKLDEANDQLSRLTKMYNAGSLAEADYQKIVSLQKQAESGYNLYRNKLKYTTLYSPVNGKAGRIWVRSGGGISQGEPIVSVIDNSSVYASVGVPENKINLIDDQHKVNVKVEATGELLEGTINKIYPSASKLTRSFTLDILLNNPSKELREGMLCTVHIKEKEVIEMVQVPMELVVHDIDGLDYVYLARKNIAYKQRVITGKIFGNNIQITKGVYNNDIIITNPPLKLMDGSKITY
ncbi:efflux RND transporter periplasmic adaptor subunit [Flammeovirga agarivorans]|uniref:Efflux RND transporter periplasmic adaptor subunit n=1 Tax=Flammeovirga agarivorans TaxID=2726742 RepID=A0A7X8XW53_9BACT|nr:efflux RND transporter periplasmic adaptor subunit [Flammeovirga agarivorans]NLR91983.1 efflux RND transporter periplasmic adaptor subunit [Flammeovirga agarivorans]